jgi:hypothetical protein
MKVLEIRMNQAEEQLKWFTKTPINYIFKCLISESKSGIILFLGFLL